MTQMKKNAVLVIIGIAIVIAIGIVYTGLVIQKPIVENTPIEILNDENQTGFGHPEALTSGPLTITQYEHKVWENIFMIISGVEKNEKGNIRIFMPDGRLWKTIEYDGSVRESFNQYFKPDTSFTRKICSQEEIVGIWMVKFDNNAYPSLEFEIINEHLSGPDFYLEKIC